MRLTFDTNVLVYAYDEKEPARRANAKRLLERALRCDAVLTQQSLCEFYAVTTRKYRLPHDVAQEWIGQLRMMFPMVAADWDCVERAMALSSHHQLQFWDALLFATAQKAGCALLLSEDGHDGMRLGGVTIVNPFNEKNRELLDAALPASD